MPKSALKVFFATSAPSGAEIVTASPPVYSAAAQTEPTASKIIFRGTELIAAAPTG